MTFNDYQQQSRTTAVYPNLGENYLYPALGLAAEVGEALNKIKKVIRDDGGALTETRRNDVASELGDILWYLANLATELQVDLGDVAAQNLEKLFSRKDRGVLQGSGDDR